jgi:integrase
MRLRGWKRLKQHKSHPPITWELTVVFATTMSKWGRHAEAVATLVAFDCFLRVGELTRIEYHDVVMPNDPRIGGVDVRMAIRLAKAKTGLNQSVSVENEQVQRTLHAYLLAYPFLEKDRIFPFSPSSFRTLIREVASALGLGDIPYVPHSFRHGGATNHFLRGASIEQIMYRGRWVALESARRYIQTARALLIMLTIPAHLNDTGRVLASRIDEVIISMMNAVASRTKLGGRHVRFRL